MELERESGQKYAHYSEAAALWRDGHSLVIYQDVSHTRSAERARAVCVKLKANLVGAQPIALVYRRNGPRAFIVIPNPAKSEVARLLRKRVDMLLLSPWKEHFERY